MPSGIRLLTRNESPQSHLSASFTLSFNLRKEVDPSRLLNSRLKVSIIFPDEKLSGIGRTALDQALMADMRSWLVDDVLMKLDKMSMLNSLEARAPFLDYRLVEFALTIPDDYRIRMGIEKHILRESFRNLLPPAIVTRKKQGFNLPMGTWLKKDLAPLCMRLSWKDPQNGFFDGRRPPACQAWRGRNLFGADHPIDPHASNVVGSFRPEEKFDAEKVPPSAGVEF
jgi:asparagine synthetase B (glutamine-hydrolysing)